MIKNSISVKLFLTLLTCSLLLIAVMSIGMIMFAKDLERDFLQQDFESERTFILGEHNTHNIFRHRSLNIIIEFIPNEFSSTPPGYPIFNGLSPGYGQTIERGDRTYYINIEQSIIGTFYHARDITAICERELKFLEVMFALCGIVISIGFLLSVLCSQGLVLPLKKLSERIMDLKIGADMQPIDMKFNDIELRNIADVFNCFLTELQQFLKRERVLIDMASHELRTPISVIMGASEVLRSRHQLDAKGLKPLNRIEDAATEMNANIDVLLKLSRRASDVEMHSQVDMKYMIYDVLDDIITSFSVTDRIEAKIIDNKKIHADATLVKMLIRNIIHNALQHTEGSIWLTLSQHALRIEDQGRQAQGVSPQLMQLNNINFERSSNGGLGLYIVTLICERIGWHLSVSANRFKGSTVEISFEPKEQQ